MLPLFGGKEVQNRAFMVKERGPPKIVKPGTRMKFLYTLPLARADVYTERHVITATYG